MLLREVFIVSCVGLGYISSIRHVTEWYSFASRCRDYKIRVGVEMVLCNFVYELIILCLQVISDECLYRSNCEFLGTFYTYLVVCNYVPYTLIA